MIARSSGVRRLKKFMLPIFSNENVDRELACSSGEFGKRFPELPVSQLPFIFPRKITRVEDNGGTDLCGYRKTVGYHPDTCCADRLKDAGNVQAVERGMDRKICGITPEDLRAFCKMETFVHDLNTIGEP